MARGATTNTGIENDLEYGTEQIVPYIRNIDNSQIITATNTLTGSTAFRTYVDASQLAGGPVDIDDDAISCIGVYDENYANSGGSTAFPMTG